MASIRPSRSQNRMLRSHNAYLFWSVMMPRFDHDHICEAARHRRSFRQNNHLTSATGGFSKRDNTNLRSYAGTVIRYVMDKSLFIHLLCPSSGDMSVGDTAI